MLTREEKKNFLLNQLPPNTDCYYVDGFINGFDCTYDAVLKDFEAEMKAKDEEIERLRAELLIATRRYDAMRVKARELEKTIKKSLDKHLKDNK